MLFNSFNFGYFFAIVVFVYFCLPHRFRWALLLAGSYYFYASWNPSYLLLIIFSTLIDYFVALRIGAVQNTIAKRILLVISLITNLGLLITFKYYNFFVESFQLVSLPYLRSLPFHEYLLPVGISFYTFQTLSYTIDVYRGEKDPERHLGIFALYVSFFPQLVAGPIERSTRLLPQFMIEHNIEYRRIVNGLKLMAWGFFQKLVIADRLASVVNTVYASPADYSAWELLFASYSFAFQIYCDFSGYSDIAIGASQVLGFDLMKNFRQPYFSTSIREFWQRWHISLSTWFRDYLYIPLGGNRSGKVRWYLNLLIIFLVSGLWHGANWTFVAWGAVHGVYLLVEITIAQIFSRTNGTGYLNFKTHYVGTLLRMILTFHVVVLAWIFFRADTISNAFYILNNIVPVFTFDGINKVHWAAVYQLGLSQHQMNIVFCAVLVLLGVQLVQTIKGSVRQHLYNYPIWVRWPLYFALVITIVMFGEFNVTEFIYFQF